MHANLQVPHHISEGVTLKDSSGGVALNRNKKNVSSRPSFDVFVGNLSYFCMEMDLHRLFNQYVNVLNVRIERDDNGIRSLLFGFVSLASLEEVHGVSSLLNGHLFMGRHIIVEPFSSHSHGRIAVSNINHVETKQNHCRVQFVASSAFTDQELVKPTESFLRKYFSRFGVVVDVQVTYYSMNTGHQEGNGFISFVNTQSAGLAVSQSPHVIQGISVTCTNSTNE